MQSLIEISNKKTIEFQKYNLYQRIKLIFR